ncbi:MAG: pyridoxamine 5'-phosphate oxidase family protein [Thermoproteota archaeon]
MIQVPGWVRDVFERYLTCEFTTVANGKPVTFPLLYFYDGDSGKFTVTSSILFSKKIEHMKKNPKVSMLFSNSEGSGIEKHGILVQGIALCDDSDLDHGWERFLPYWRKKEPYIDAFLAEREKFGWFWKRIVIQVEPKKIMAWKNGNTDEAPEVYG